MKVATWNVNQAGDERAEIAGRTLREHEVDIALLQEVSPSSFATLQREAGFDWGISLARNFGPMLDVVGRGGTRCVAIAGKNSECLASSPFPDLHLPEKVLAAWVDVSGVLVTFVDYHAPHGGHGHLKPEQAVRIAKWMAAQRGPIVMGGDFNTPERDPLEDTAVRTHWNTGAPGMGSMLGDDLLVGARPVHELRDTFRTLLAGNPELRAGIQPDGPLATTITVKDGPMRYDQIWATAEFEVRDVVHDTSVLKTQFNPDGRFDHALVVADLVLT